jgi:hypothetical protein
LAILIAPRDVVECHNKAMSVRRLGNGPP